MRISKVPKKGFFASEEIRRETIRLRQDYDILKRAEIFGHGPPEDAVRAHNESVKALKARIKNDA